MSSLVPEFAPVRPRVRGIGDESSRLLEELVDEYADDYPSGIVWLLGSEGAGKTTALAHLAAVFTDDDRFTFVDDSDQFVDETQCRQFVEQSEESLVVAARTQPVSTGHRVFRLEPWSVDELVEYLLHANCAQCEDVMRRLGPATSVCRNPEIARTVLDEMLADPDVCDFWGTLDTSIRRQLNSDRQLRKARQFCLAVEGQTTKVVQSLASKKRRLPTGIQKLLRHREVQLPLAARQLADELKTKRRVRALERQLSLTFVETVGALARADEEVLASLANVLRSRSAGKNHAMAASILVAADSTWRLTPSTRGLDYAGAYFSRVNWPEISLCRAHLQLAEFHEANLAGATFDEAILVETDFVNANLHAASLQRALATGADFDRANLRDADLSKCKLDEASCVSTDFANSVLTKTSLYNANLAGANLCGAALGDAILVGANVDGADMTDCDLRRIDARRVDFRTATLHGANCEQAWLNQCNFEDVHWPQAQLTEAELRGAYLTGSVLHRANLHRADLSEARLAEVDWQEADLTGVNLSNATFHMGSSRSGLVDSPIASEGSRTGFYTDDLEELYFKSPEEVRKANLYGADLRGANTTNVDFYLVDLRRAKLDPHQRVQASRTGAILS